MSSIERSVERLEERRGRLPGIVFNPSAEEHEQLERLASAAGEEVIVFSVGGIDLEEDV